MWKVLLAHSSPRFQMLPLFKKTANMLHKFDALCNEEWAFLQNPHCYRGGDWEDHYTGKLFRKAAAELRTFFGRTEAARQFDPACGPSSCHELARLSSCQHHSSWQKLACVKHL